MDEQILVCMQTELPDVLGSEGFVPAGDDLLLALLRASVFMRRGDAEGNPLWRQIIPYIVLLQNGRAFAVERLNTQSEARLHGQLSVGIGGHLNEADIALGALRELHEELCLDDATLGGLVFRGFINDYSTAVSRDHLGCLYTVEASGHVFVRESDKMAGLFRSSAFLQANRARLENWSAIALDYLLNQGLVPRESED